MFIENENHFLKYDSTFHPIFRENNSGTNPQDAHSKQCIYNQERKLQGFKVEADFALWIRI